MLNTNLTNDLDSLHIMPLSLVPLQVQTLQTKRLV